MKRKGKRGFFSVGIVLVACALCFAVTGGDRAEGAKPAAAAEQTKLVLWWWGEQEFAGLTGWLNDTIAIFEKEHPGVKVEATLQATENVFSDFPTASAAGNPPDLQYMWNGVYTMDWAWLGYTEPLNGHFTTKELDRMYSIPLTSFEGKAYRAGWYAFAFGWVYNKKMLKESGVSDSMIPPKTFDDWLKVCQKVKDKGHVPISLGSKDKLLGDWMQAIFIYQQFDSYSDVLRLCTGALRWDDPKYYAHWVKIKELFDKGYINKDVNSLDLYQGQEMLTKGEAAFTIAVGSIVPNIIKQLGDGNVGYMSTPKYGTGKLAGVPCMDIQGIGISSSSKNKKLAAEFIRTMHRKDRMTRLYTDLGGFPASKDFDAKQIKGDVNKTMWDMIQKGIVYASDVIPYAVTDGAANSGIQQLFAGTKQPKDLGAEAQRLLEEWKAQNPDLAQNYMKWMK
jgi:ABC-type glycerol-3-phosphate transport system substrate-binding protein